MRAKKPKPAEPSLRDKLSKNFLEALEADFREYGKGVIEQMREKDPTRYAELAGKLIMTVEPREGSDACKNMRDVAISLLKSVGANEYEITEDMITEALKRNEEFIDQLQAIRAAAEGQMQ